MSSSPREASSSRVFRFIQVELPWQLGPPDGRYLVRTEGDGEGPPSHVLVFTTLGAARRREKGASRRRREAEPQPEATPVATGRATIIDVSDSLEEPAARAWLEAAGEGELAVGLAVLNRALHAFRVVTADPYLQPVGRAQTLVARVGYGAGEEVADGLWSAAKELNLPEGRRRRARVLAPQARLAALLGSRQPALACEELALRARLDLDQGRGREAALQLLVALDAALAELAADRHARELAERLDELRGQREPVAAAAQAALAGPLGVQDAAAAQFALERVEAALRARALAGGAS